jgi:glycosyltransferase involved in cell wall biosynthesis
MGCGSPWRRAASAHGELMRALILAYHFPPIGGGGAQRSLKFARYLPEFGYAVTVVTGRGTSTDRWSPSDETLLAEFPATCVRRLPQPEPDPSGRWQARAERWLGLTSPRSRWWTGGAVREGLRLSEDVDVICASMSPFNTAEAAMILSRELGKPWVADLRDPWALDEMMIYPSLWHRRRELERMRRLLGTSAAVVTTTPEAARRIRAQLPELADRPVVSIPNGFDRSDFEAAPPERRDSVFCIVHTGYLHTDIGRRQHRARVRRLLGGSVRGVDILPRSHVYLLEAIERLIERDPSLRSRIEVLLAGVLSRSDREVADRSPVVRVLGYLPHHVAIALMRSADLLFLPMYNLPSGVRSGIVPGKTYEYLAAQRPILAAVPPGDTRDILVQAGSAHICAPDDVEGMADAIEGQLKGWAARPARVPNEILERFERRFLTGELAAVLDAVTGGHTADDRHHIVRTALVV